MADTEVGTIEQCGTTERNLKDIDANTVNPDTRKDDDSAISDVHTPSQDSEPTSDSNSTVNDTSRQDTAGRTAEDPSIPAVNGPIDASPSDDSAVPAQNLTACGVTDLHAASGACAAPTTDASEDSNGTSIYHVKWVKFRDNDVAIVTQNENGPCPLLALVNILLLSQRVKLPPMTQIITASQLMEYLGDCVLESVPKNVEEPQRLNYEQNMHDAMAVIHKLQTGLDVNVKFTGVQHFEYTPECIVFDLLQVHLYHGWLVDPACPEEQRALGQCSYNQLVEKVIANQTSSDSDAVTQALVAQRFLEQSMSQLTYHGLSELSTTVKQGELCVLFRNNHFSTLYKHQGDCHFVDADFHTYTRPEPAPLPEQTVPANTPQQLDHDYLLALSMQQEDQRRPEVEMGSFPEWNPDAMALSDHDLALRMQQEEERLASQQQGQGQRGAPRDPAQRPAAPPRERKKSSECILL